MAFYFVTGKLGNGKSLVSVSRIDQKIRQGLPVATNIDLFLEPMYHKYAKTKTIIRLPDIPKIFDFESIGYGNTSYDESKNGLLVLDECGSWFNSRNWKDKGRSEINDWFRHARKYGWDVILIVQDISMMDSQARDALAEFVVYCRKLSNIRVPLVSGLVKLVTGTTPKLPAVHSARVVYGTNRSDPLSDRWVYKGIHLYSAYDTKQIFTDTYPHGPHCVLSPYQLNHRFKSPRNIGFYMRLSKIYFKKFKAPLAVFLGISLGLVFSFFMTVYLNDRFYSEYEKLREALDKLDKVNSPASVESGGFSNAVYLPSDYALNPVELFEGYKIVGYSNISELVDYQLSSSSSAVVSVGPSGDSEAAQVVSTNKLGQYFDITPISSCHVRISSGTAYKDLFCF